jgi:hypothetical protein
MSSGFNTDVRLGEQVFHIQTEDYGPGRSMIDTAVYQSGRVLYRRLSDYGDFALSSAFSESSLREKVERQHRAVIEDLRSGRLEADISAALKEANRAGVIQVELLNPRSWLSSRNVSLDIQIIRRSDRQPLAGAQVEASIEGSVDRARHTGTSDEGGRVRIEFPLPPLGGEPALVIRARSDSGEEEIRFAMRPRPKTPPAGTRQ